MELDQPERLQLLAPVARDDADFADAATPQGLDLSRQQRLAMQLGQALRLLLRQCLHAAAATGGQDDGAHHGVPTAV